MTQTTISRRHFLQAAAATSLAPVGHRLLRRGQAFTETRPNYLIVLFDALSARHLSLFGYPRETTPNLARFADRATVFHRHYAAANFTTPGTASLLTGTYPWTHRAFNFWGTTLPQFEDRNLFRLLQVQGYHTVAYSHNPLANLLLNQFRGGIDTLLAPEELSLLYLYPLAESLFRQDRNTAFRGESLLLSQTGQPSSLLFSMLHGGWSQFRRQQFTQKLGDQFPRGVPRTNEGSMTFLLADAIDWLIAELPRLPQPYLTYFHLYPPHGPYTTHRNFHGIFDDGWAPPAKPDFAYSSGRDESQLNRARRRYDEYISYLDAEFGRLIESLDASGHLDNTLVVFTADHGELFERGIQGHGTVALYEPVIHIPLVMRAPGQTTRIDVGAPTSCIDLLPTLLALNGQSIPSWCEGQPLPAVVGAFDEDRSLFAFEAKTNPKPAALSLGTVALIKGWQKLIYYFGYHQLDQVFEQFELALDAEELDNRYSPSAIESRDLEAELKARMTEISDPIRDS